MSETEVQIIDEESTQIIDLKPLKPKDGENAISPFRLGQLTRNTKILEVSAVISALTNADDNFESIANVLNNLDDQTSRLNTQLDELDESVKFLLNTRDIANQMIVTQLSTWYYDDEQLLHSYSSLKEALDKNPDFSGKVNYAADIELTGDVLNFNNRKLVIDLNGHTLSCNRSRLLGVYFGSDITIQNGTIYAPRIHVPTRFYVQEINGNTVILRQEAVDGQPEAVVRTTYFMSGSTHYLQLPTEFGNSVKIKKAPSSMSIGEQIADVDWCEYKFQINRGRLLLKNMHFDFDGIKNQSIWNYRAFNLSQQLNEMLDAVGRSELEFDKDCVVRFHDCNHGECLVCSISPYSNVASVYSSLSEDSGFLAKYPTQRDYELAIQPTVTIDGDLRMTKSDGVEVANWPGFIAGTGADWLETVVNVEKHARIFAQEHGIYLGNNGIININGGYIVAGTGICMRSGKLNIPRDANPTIIGIAEPKEVEIKEGLSGQYDPYHTLKHGSDWGTNLRLGHAILLENNNQSYGKHPVEADIQSGTFISYNNTAIGSYGIGQVNLPAKDRAKDSEGNDLSSTYNTSAVYFCKRLENFADGITIHRRESQQSYDYFSGENPDYNTALISADPQLNAVKFEKGHKANLTTEAGLKSAVRDILVLLGDKSEDIQI